MATEGDLSSLSTDQIDLLITIERTGASFSMVAIILITASFTAFKRLRITPNLFIVFASLANAGASVASMMGYDGLVKGDNSSVCQAQAFIFEWFMQSDPWWSFAMAFNVFLVFFCNVDPTGFRKYWWAYCIVCFGGPLVPAIVLISIHDDSKGPIFGDATLWCWIGSQWGHVRLYAYYIPIWICILLSILIYIAVGYQVFRNRNRLHNAGFTDPERQTSVVESTYDHEDVIRPVDYYGTAVTEVKVTSDPVHHQDSKSTQRSGHTTTIITSSATSSSTHINQATQSPINKSTMISRLQKLTSHASTKLKRLDSVKMAYLRTSFIFAFAVLITWIPSSVNRVYSLTNDDRVNFKLSVASGCVLPLQGVWNAFIFFTTSWRAVRLELKGLRARYHKTHVQKRSSIRLNELQ